MMLSSGTGFVQLRQQIEPVGKTVSEIVVTSRHFSSYEKN